jgi:hypothetical protein
MNKAVAAGVMETIAPAVLFTHDRLSRSAMIDKL